MFDILKKITSVYSGVAFHNNLQKERRGKWK